MKPSPTWRALIVVLGFLITFSCAVPVTYLPGLHGSIARGPVLGLFYFGGLMAGMVIMAIGLTWPTVFFPEWAPKDEEP